MGTLPVHTDVQFLQEFTLSKLVENEYSIETGERESEFAKVKVSFSSLYDKEFYVGDSAEDEIVEPVEYGTRFAIDLSAYQ